MHPSSPGILLPATQASDKASDNEGHLAEEHHPVPKRTRRVTFEVKYMEVLDFFDEHPVTEAYKFKVGSSFGDIPQAEHTKTTDLGATVLDGFVEFFFKLHAENRSYGGDFDVSDMLVAVQDPLHVIINKCANLKASKLNIHKDLMKLVNALVKTRFGEDGKRPAYVGDFISRVEDLSPESDVEKEAWEIRLWVIRHHPLFIEPAKRRLLLTVFYKFYKTLDHTAAEQLIEKINKFCHPSFTAPKDKLIAAIYRKNHQRDYTAEPDLQEENDSYIAVFLHNFVVRGPEEAWAYGIELQELELIVAYYFGRLLPTFLEEMSSTTDKHEMLKEILAMYAERRSIARRAPG